MNLNNYFKIQNDELEKLGKELDVEILAAVKNGESLEKYYKKKNCDVKKYQDNNSYVIDRGDGTYELFVLGSYPKYRKRFEDFLKEFYRFPQDFKLPRDINVDHVFNKERAKEYFIRMMLLEEKNNKSWGASYEKINTQLDHRYKRVNGTEYIFLDYAVFMKMLGIYPIKKGSVNNVEDIVAITNDYYRILVEEMGFLILEEPFKRFIRAEFNFVLRGIWRDPLENSYMTTIKYYDHADRKKVLFEDLEAVLEVSYKYFYKNYIFSSEEDKLYCQVILSDLDSAVDIRFGMIINCEDPQKLIGFKVSLEFNDINLNKTYYLFVNES